MRILTSFCTYTVLILYSHWVSLRRQARFEEMFGEAATSRLVASETQNAHPLTVPGESVLKIESDRKIAEKFGTR
jgi:hypothetical protein